MAVNLFTGYTATKASLIGANRGYGGLKESAGRDFRLACFERVVYSISAICVAKCLK